VGAGCCGYWAIGLFDVGQCHFLEPSNTIQEYEMSTLPIVRDIMTRNVVCLKPSMSMEEAIDLLLRNRISGAPVVNDLNEVIGVLSEKDCLRQYAEGVYERTPLGNVEDHMSKNVTTIDPDSDIFVAIGLFFANSFRRVPVIEGGKLVGLVSRPDVLKGVIALYRPAPEHRSWADSQFMTDEIRAKLGSVD